MGNTDETMGTEAQRRAPDGPPPAAAADHLAAMRDLALTLRRSGFSDSRIASYIGELETSREEARKNPQLGRSDQRVFLAQMAANERRMLEFDYRPADNAEPTTRRVQPWGIASRKEGLCLIAFDLGKKRYSAFRFTDIVGNPTVVGPPYSYSYPYHGTGPEWEDIPFEDSQTASETAKPLPRDAPSDINKSQSVSRSKSERVRRFDYPQPDSEAELSAIQSRAAEVAAIARTAADLGTSGADVLVAGLHEMAERSEQLAKDIGMYAVSQGGMTQLQLSRLLGVHELTVGRWVKAAQEPQE